MMLAGYGERRGIGAAAYNLLGKEKKKWKTARGKRATIVVGHQRYLLPVA
jgi:hypothetical protein